MLEANALEKKFEEGEAKGRAEGEAVERAKALAEKRKMARNLLKKGISLSIIQGVTGISEKELICEE